MAKVPGTSSAHVSKDIASFLISLKEDKVLVSIFGSGQLPRQGGDCHYFSSLVAGHADDSRVQDDGVFITDGLATLNAGGTGLVLTGTGDEESNGHLASFGHASLLGIIWFVVRHETKWSAAPTPRRCCCVTHYKPPLEKTSTQVTGSKYAGI
jgi:hypothetical protein